MRRFIVATVLIAFLPASAYSQAPATARTDKERKEDAEIDKAYEDATKRIQDKKQPLATDPWQTVRPATSDNTKR
jgi:hypothetical protein